MAGLEVGSLVKVDHFVGKLVEISVTTADIGLEEVFLASVVWGSGLVDVFAVMVELFDHSHDIHDLRDIDSAELSVLVEIGDFGIEAQSIL
jgi:hypothetical protein